MVCGVLVPMVNWHIYDGTINAEGTYRFYRDVPAYFPKTSHILHELEEHGFVVKECRYSTDQHAVQTCLTLKMCGELQRAKYNNGDPRLWSYVKQDWERIPLSEFQQLESSVPKHLVSVVKRNTNNKHAPVARFMGVTYIKFRMSVFFIFF